MPAVVSRPEKHSIGIIQKICSGVGRRVDEASLVDARLRDGSRVNAVIPPIARKPSLTIRKFAKDPLTIDDMVSLAR